MVTQGSPLGARPEIQGSAVQTDTFSLETAFSSPLPTSPAAKPFLNLSLAPHIALPVSSILARVSDWSGSLYGASPLNLSWGHGGGLSFCTSVQSGVGDRWAKECLLKMTERANLSSGFKEKTVWHREACASRPMLGS